MLNDSKRQFDTRQIEALNRWTIWYKQFLFTKYTDTWITIRHKMGAHVKLCDVEVKSSLRLVFD
jgi:hypothetical protein